MVNPAPYPRPFGPFVLLRPIGRGGMSEVELARQALTEANFVRFLVIKRIHERHMGDDSFVRMFQDEARINAELQHENIAQVYAFGHAENEYYLAMEYVPGFDLRVLRSTLEGDEVKLPLRAVLRIVHDVLSALEYAHGRVDTFGRPMNIVHRDVNPTNIMWSIRGEVKLIDFGVAKSDTKSEQTKEHALKGKLAYMAPEQIDAIEQIDGRADLFSLGLVLHELVSGKRAFADLGEVQTFHRILSGKFPPLEFITDHPQPELIVALRDRALEVDRNARFPSAAAMQKAVIEAAEPMGGLPSSEEMARILRDLVPTRVNEVAERLRNFGRIDLTGYFRRGNGGGETLVRASNVTEAFEILPRTERTRNTPRYVDEITEQLEECREEPSPESTETPKPTTRHSAIEWAGLSILLIGYLALLGSAFLVWSLLDG